MKKLIPALFIVSVLFINDASVETPPSAKWPLVPAVGVVGTFAYGGTLAIKSALADEAPSEAQLNNDSNEQPKE